MFTKATRRIPTDGVAVFDAPHRRSPVVTVMAWPMIVRRKRRGSGGFGEAERFRCAWVWDTAMPNSFPQNLEECTGRSIGGCARLSADCSCEAECGGAPSAARDVLAMRMRVAAGESIAIYDQP
jgi:hypothetical protein